MTEAFRASEGLSTRESLAKAEPLVSIGAPTPDPTIHPGTYFERLVAGIENKLDPPKIKQLFQYFHSSDIDTFNFAHTILQSTTNEDMPLFVVPFGALDRMMDSVVGIEYTDVESNLVANRETIKAEHPDESLWLSGGNGIWTDYASIRKAITTLEMDDKDVFYDLGSGYGRSVLYAGMVTTAKCNGIELLPERAQKAAGAAGRLGLRDVSFRVGNVREADYSDGTAFFMYIPFSAKTLKIVLGRLKEVAAEHPVRIYYHAGSINLEEHRWLGRLQTASTSGDYSRLSLYESR